MSDVKQEKIENGAKFLTNWSEFGYKMGHLMPRLRANEAAIINHHQAIFILADQSAKDSLFSYHPPWRKETRMSLLVVVFGLFFAFHVLSSIHWGYQSRRNETVAHHGNYQVRTNDEATFKKADVHVPENRVGFPSFWNYAPSGPISVSYDERAILLNGTRSLFLGGSMHPARATPETWESALDEAVKNGLNLVTIYVFWSTHQPFEDSPFDWSLPCAAAAGRFDHKDRTSECDWDLASAIRQAANRGLFVHARIGPYVDSEFSYGAIPAWVALNKPDLSMRRPNRKWMSAMEGFLKEAIGYLTRENLWAYQGGPIILGQVENELGDDDLNLASDIVIEIKTENGSLRNATMQDYANWSGETAAKYAPDVVWTMCNGLTAANAINTCNGFGPKSCSQDWLESHGQNKRIQIDQPALWTENEGGFQVWGETSHLSYIWGRTARDFARDGLKWFARGGTHINYYMFWGSYNRGQSAAGGITNMYANDAMLCPSGERRQPKYGHLQSFHETIIELAPMLLENPSALLKNQTIMILGPNGWTTGTEQQMFSYTSSADGDGDSASSREVCFIENDSSDRVLARVHMPPYGHRHINLEGQSSVVFLDGLLQFDSAAISPRMKAFRRSMIESPVELLDWEFYPEPVGVDPLDPATIRGSAPMEQTELMFESRVLTEYVWYETVFKVDTVVTNATIFIDTQRASAMNVFIDGTYLGSQADPDHEEGPITLAIQLNSLTPGNHTVSILSESFGYGNEIGRWGYSTKAKTKGITGLVVITGTCQTAPCKFNLVDGREWLSSAGLRGKPGVSFVGMRRREDEVVTSFMRAWSHAVFHTPENHHDEVMKSLFLDITMGRGRLWLNGHDLGRYWNITRGDTLEYSQRYYFLPQEMLYTNGQLNELILFNSLGGDLRSTNLVLSWLVADKAASLEDVVDYPSACV